MDYDDEKLRAYGFNTDDEPRHPAVTIAILLGYAVAVIALIAWIAHCNVKT